MQNIQCVLEIHFGGQREAMSDDRLTIWPIPAIHYKHILDVCGHYGAGFDLSVQSQQHPHVQDIDIR